jgi:hypothetical protein
MASQPVIISSQVVNEADLRKLLDDTSKVTGAKITVIPQWVVTSDSPAVECALAALFGIPPEGKEIVSVKLTKRGRKAAKPVQVVSAQVEPPAFQIHEVRSWEVHVPGVSGKAPELPEKITITEKNVRLSKGMFETGTLLRHPSAGWQKVTGEKGTGQGMEPIDAKDAIAILDGAK